MSLERLEAQDREAAEADLLMSVAMGPTVEDLALLGARLLGEIVHEPQTLEAAGGTPAIVLTMDQLQAIVGRSWTMGTAVALNTALGRGPCRICGCWQEEACDGGCGWAEPGLCTSCAIDEHDRCEVCLKPILPGSPVRRYDDVGEVHAICSGADEANNRAGGRIPVDPDEFTGEGPPPDFVEVYLSEAAPAAVRA